MTDMKHDESMSLMKHPSSPLLLHPHRSLPPHRTIASCQWQQPSNEPAKRLLDLTSTLIGPQTNQCRSSPAPSRHPASPPLVYTFSPPHAHHAAHQHRPSDAACVSRVGACQGGHTRSSGAAIALTTMRPTHGTPRPSMLLPPFLQESLLDTLVPLILALLPSF